MIKTFKKIAFLFVLMWVVAGTPSCSLLRPSADKKAERMQKKQDKKSHKEYEKAKKEHMERQAESTQEMMKRAKKEQRKANRLHRRTLWDRLFRRSCKTG